MTTIKSTFEELENVCYAVGVNMTQSKFKHLGNGRDYFIMATKEDVFKNKLTGYYESHDFKGLFQKDLKKSDIIEFKDSQEKYIKVIHNDSGRVYELKSKSFKKHLTK